MCFYSLYSYRVVSFFSCHLYAGFFSVVPCFWGFCVQTCCRENTIFCVFACTGFGNDFLGVSVSFSSVGGRSVWRIGGLLVCCGAGRDVRAVLGVLERPAPSFYWLVVLQPLKWGRRVVTGLSAVFCADGACLGMGRGQDGWVVRESIRLSSEEQGALVATYLEGRLCAESSRGRSRVSASSRAKVEEGSRALSLLVESLLPLVHVIADEHVVSRFGHEWGEKEREDARGEAMVAVMEALNQYDKERTGKVHQWVAQQVRLHLSGLEYDNAGGSKPREWRRVARVAFTEIEKRQREGLSTATKDISVGVYEHFYNETCASVRNANPEMTVDEVDKAAKERLSRQSLTKAITKEMSSILETSRMCASLDAEIDEDGSSLYDTVCDTTDRIENTDPAYVVREVLGTLSESDIDCVLSVSGGSVPQAESAAYANRHGLTVAQARVELRAMGSRVTAPHAQFAALGNVLFHEQGGQDSYEDVLSLAYDRVVG